MSVVRWSILAMCAMPILSGCGGSSMRAGPRAVEAPRSIDPAMAGTLDVSWWVLPNETGSDADDSSRLERVLGAYQSHDLGVPDEQIRLWRENGLRVIAVPTNEVEDLRMALQASGPVEQQVLAQSGTWKSAYKGPAWTGSALLRLDNGPLELPAGALRAMVRSWLVPVQASVTKTPAAREEEGPGSTGAAAPVSGERAPRPRVAAAPAPHVSSASVAALQFEVALQHQETRRPVSEFQAALAIDTPKTLNDDGLVFWRLTLGGLMRAGWSYLIVPVEPGVEWTSSALDRLAEQGAAKVAEGTGAGPTAIAGPALRAPPTLGDALLSDAVRGRPDRRYVLVLTPNVPERFELLPSGAGR